jgi:uncharacterized protein (TIGR02268 family)
MPAVALAFLLVGTAAAAQPSPPVRERVERRATLPGDSEGPMPEVHVARGVLTTVVLDGPVDKSSLELEGRLSRFKLVDVGERLITVEPSVELEPEERLGLRVRLKDGTPVALILTSHPTQVDTRLDLERPRSRESLLTELAEKEAELSALRARAAAVGAVGMVFAGLLDRKGVRASDFSGVVPPGNRSGLKLEDGVGYRARTWALVAVQVRNLPGQRPWAPGAARLHGAAGVEVKVLGVHLARPALSPGESSWVVVETDRLPAEAGEVFRLELVDKGGGRLLPIDGVKLKGAP